MLFVYMNFIWSIKVTLGFYTVLLLFNYFMIHKITPTADFQLRVKCLDTQLNESTNQNSIKVPKVEKQRNMKRY